MKAIGLLAIFVFSGGWFVLTLVIGNLIIRIAKDIF